MRRHLNPPARPALKFTGPLLSALAVTLTAGWLGSSLPALAPARGDDDPARPRNGYPVAYAIKDAKIIAAPGKVHDPGIGEAPRLRAIGCDYHFGDDALWQVNPEIDSKIGRIADQ